MKPSYQWKRFDEIEDLVVWLNSLERLGDFQYALDAVFSTPKGIYVILDGHGPDWEGLFND